MTTQPAAHPSDPLTDRTVRRWTRIFIGIYLTFTVAAVLVTLLSVLAVHCGARREVVVQGPQIRSSGSDPAELRSCHAELERLLRDLHKEAFTVQARALRFDTDPATEWQNWSAAWRGRWQALEHRCRFRELEGKGLSPEVDKMVDIHRRLEELQFSYGGLVTRFSGTYLERLRHLRSELQRVRALIDRRKPGATGAQSEQRGASR